MFFYLPPGAPCLHQPLAAVWGRGTASAVEGGLFVDVDSFSRCATAPSWREQKGLQSVGADTLGSPKPHGLHNEPGFRSIKALRPLWVDRSYETLNRCRSRPIRSLRTSDRCHWCGNPYSRRPNKRERIATTVCALSRNDRL